MMINDFFVILNVLVEVLFVVNELCCVFYGCGYLVVELSYINLDFYLFVFFLVLYEEIEE